jgi:hypothetical protein
LFSLFCCKLTANNPFCGSPSFNFQDVMQDYAKRTVTIDPHPHNNKQQGDSLSLAVFARLL